jgi:hypothetical protein
LFLSEPLLIKVAISLSRSTARYFQGSMLMCLLLLSFGASAYDPDHAAFTQILQKHVRWNAAGTASMVDYDGLKRDPKPLQAYNQSLGAVTNAQFKQFSLAERQAFLINAYNAYTLQLILTRYPNLASIKELGSLLRSPWKQSFVPLLGQTRSLDDIEHTLLRGAPDFAEPRIHFAVNCASIGCPALRPEAFTAKNLSAQLEDQTIRFLKDRTRNRWNAEEEALEISSIFDWYSGDFEKGYLGANSVAQFLARYSSALQLTPAQRQALIADELDIEYTDYDWNLNRIPIVK